MFQRKNNSLPTTSFGGPSNNTGGFGLHLGKGKNGPDGSGKAIKMDAPVVKAWKQSSTFTKYSYYILLFFIMLIFIGYRYLRYWNGENSVVSLFAVSILFVYDYLIIVIMFLLIFAHRSFFSIYLADVPVT